jgi:hypothetical protein
MAQPNISNQARQMRCGGRCWHLRHAVIDWLKKMSATTVATLKAEGVMKEL